MVFVYNLQFSSLDDKITYEQLKTRVINKSDGISKGSAPDSTVVLSKHKISCLDDFIQTYGEESFKGNWSKNYSHLMKSTNKRNRSTEDERLRKIALNLPRK